MNFLEPYIIQLFGSMRNLEFQFVVTIVFCKRRRKGGWEVNRNQNYVQGTLRSSHTWCINVCECVATTCLENKKKLALHELITNFASPPIATLLRQFHVCLTSKTQSIWGIPKVVRNFEWLLTH